MEEGRSHRRILWDDFDFDLSRRVLWRRGIRIKLQKVPLQVLELLLERPGELVRREEFHQKIWNGYNYGDFDHSLNIAINKLRTALNDPAKQPRYIETIPQVGYRFLVPVDVRGADLASLPTTEAPAPSARRSWAWLAASILLLLIAGILAWQFPWRHPPPDKRVMLAVLPFENLTGDASQEYFSDGMTEDLITELGRLGTDQMGVIARTSALFYKKSSKPIREIGRELGVEYVLIGSVRTEGERFRVTAQLVRVSDQTYLWAESYDRDLTSVLAVQKSVARSVAELIHIELTPAAQHHLARAPAVDPAAYKLYLRGRHAWRQRTSADVQKALEYFRQAVALDPGFALAYVGIADCFTLEGGEYLGVPRAKARAAALEAVRRALELDDSLAEAQATLGESLYYGNWDWVGAEKAFRRSLELNPNYATGHQWYSEFLSMAGRHDEAIAEMKVARALDPHAPILAATLGWAFYHARRYDEAIRECRATLGLYPDQGPARACLVTSLYDSGRRQEAFQEFMKVISLPGSTLSPQTLAAYQRGGWPAIWMHQWEQLRQLKAGGEDVSYYDQALLALRSDRPDDALELLEKSLAEREESLVQLKAYAHFDPLLDHPRFQRLLVQVNFPPEVASSREGQN